MQVAQAVDCTVRLCVRKWVVILFQEGRLKINEPPEGTYTILVFGHTNSPKCGCGGAAAVAHSTLLESTPCARRDTLSPRYLLISSSILNAF